VRQPQRGIPHVLGLLAENRVEQFELGRGFDLAFRRNLSDKNVAGTNLRAHADDSLFVKIVEVLFGGVGDFVGNPFRPQLRLAHFGDKLLNMDGSEHIVLHHTLGD
jgi:hypothetical protein